MAAPADYENPDEWELVDDDGFVHKRRKRPRLDPADEPPPPDPAAERKRRREWKTAALLKLRDKYLTEITRWELLSNTLREMEQNSQTQSVELLDSRTTSFDGSSSSEEGSVPDSTRRRVVDDLLYQVEAQGAIIRDVLSLCDIAEKICRSGEEQSKQQFIDLPIWEPSPQDIVAALGNL